MKYNLLVLSLFLAACGGGSSGLPDLSLSPYNGEGLGETRIKSITTTNESEVWVNRYYYDAPEKGRLSSIVSHGNPRGDETKNFEYDATSKLLSKVITSGFEIRQGRDLSVAYTERISFHYGDSIFLPTNKFIVDEVDSLLVFDSIPYTTKAVNYYKNNTKGAFGLDKVKAETLWKPNYEGALETQETLYSKSNTTYQFNKGRQTKKKIVTELKLAPSLNNTDGIGTPISCEQNVSDRPDNYTILVDYTYDSSNQLISRFVVENWFGSITQKRSDYIYKNGRLKTRKDFIKYIEEAPTENTPSGSSTFGPCLGSNLGSPSFPTNEWILQNTSTYEYESGDCYYHYPNAAIASTEIEILCPH